MLTQDPSKKNDMFELWMRMGHERGAWALISIYEKRYEKAEHEVETTRARATVDQLIHIMRNADIARKMARKYCLQASRWRRHPVVPEDLDALQVLADIS